MTLIARKPSQALVDLVGTMRGTWRGNIASCRCPAHDDHRPSLSLRQGDKDILVTCFAGCDPAAVLRELDRISVTRRYDLPASRPLDGRGNADRLWSEAIPVTGTLGECYLASRFLLPAPPDIRFHPHCPQGSGPGTVFKPALLVAVREMRKLTAVQRIFLNTSGKHYSQKLTIGPMGEGAWQGGGLSSTMGLAEGFETARAWSLLHNLPCWASLGSRRLDLVAIPASVTTLVLVGDNDFAGHRAVNRSSRRYQQNGRVIRADFPVGYSDWAEVLEAKERGGGGRG